MAKVIDITDKLNFDDNPVMIINGHEVEVHSDAETVLRLVGVFSSNDNQIKAVDDALRLMFRPEDMEMITSMKKNGRKLSARSLMTIIEQGMNLIMGDEEQGEQ